MTVPPDVELDVDALARIAFERLDRASLGRDDAESSTDVGDGPLTWSQPLYVGLRAGGRLVATGWHDGDDPERALDHALRQARDRLTCPVSEIEHIEICLTHDWREVELRDPPQRARLFGNGQRGVAGLEFRHADEIERVAPTQVVAQNRVHEKWLKRFGERCKLAPSTIYAQIACRVFQGQQLLLTRADVPRGRKLYRGQELIPQSAIDRELVSTMAHEFGEFMINSVCEDGRMVYIWYPSQDREDPKRNNMIRQWMASVALGRAVRARSSEARAPELEELWDRNIRYNLGEFYREYEEGGSRLAGIEFRGKVKLGSVALAVIALMEHARRKRYREQERRLWAMLEHLWHEDGSFRTFYKPADRNDVQNFYPGEALLALAMRHDEEPSRALSKAFLQSMRYYRHRHLRSRNPAFVPWHTRAYFRVWQATRRPALAEWIFEMNDWLLAMCQWRDTAKHPDMLGRFFDPANPGYGPPHASATGVYLEGLVDAYRLARELGDLDRQRAYGAAIFRGLRSIRQLMVRSQPEMFYLGDASRAALVGGVRNTVYDNIVRIDNVQHAYMAALELLEHFEDADIRLAMQAAQ